jgi:aspartate/methionine/tyrosine aminotransferase
MVPFSRRVPGDLGLNRLAAARARLGEAEFDLTLANPTRCGVPYPARLLTSLADRRGLHYDPQPRGADEARRAVAGWYARFDVEVPPERIVLTASTSEAYSFLLRLLADPGDSILVPTPSYPLFEQLARLDGVRLLRYELDPEARWRLDPAALTRTPSDCKAVVVVHPNNPTGSFIHPDDARMVEEQCRVRGHALVADEVFLPYPLEGAAGAGRSFAATSSCLCFTLGGLSKSIGLPQLKLAWIVVGGPQAAAAVALERLEYVADAYLSVGTPVALAAGTLLESGEALHRAISDRCLANLETLRGAVATSPSVTLLPAEGGWSAVLKIPNVTDEESAVLQLFESCGVAVQPGYFFDFPSEGYLVLSLLPEEEIFSEGVQRLLAFIEELVSGGG